MLAVAVTVQVERQKPEEAVVATAPMRQKDESTAQDKLAKVQPIAPPAPAPAPNAEAPSELAKQNEAAGARSDASRDRAAEAPPPARPEIQSSAESHPKVAPEASARKHAELYSTIGSPEVWLERIAELRKQGKDEEADKALAEFRKRYPGYRLTDEMRAKVEKK